MNNNTAGRRIIALIALLLLAALINILVLVPLSQIKKDNKIKEAYIYGASIANAIQLTLDSTLEATEALKYFYLQYGEDCFKDFDSIAANIAADNPSIGSMYIAPKGVIRVAYPKEVNASTIGFEMLKDPEQGPRAQLAVDTGRITVAGPHELVEGGVGFIIRNPVFVDGEFIGFTIIVLDWDLYVTQMLQKVQPSSTAYKYAIWKDDHDETAVTDKDGFILRNSDEVISNVVDIEFSVPNDTWHLIIEPVGGWAVFSDMIGSIICSLMITGFLIAMIITIYFSSERKKQLQKEQGENEAKNKYMARLTEAMEHAQKADAAKTTFLFNMSHDIRTPMNAIIGYSDLVIQHADNKEKVLDYMQKIKTANGVLLSLVNNVLELARIESGKVTLDESCSCVSDIAEASYVVFSDLMQKKSITFTRTVDVQHRYVYCDSEKVGQIILNLLSNAQKYTPSGGSISLAMKELPCEKEGFITLSTTVSDTGIGMSPEFVEHIFEEFSRERTSTESKTQGTGLGMAIVKQLVDLMGGTIHIDSTVGKGTSITVLLPHRIAEEHEAASDAVPEADLSSDLCGLNVLMAEDNDLNAEITEELLHMRGCTVTRAVDGVDCIEKLRSNKAHTFDLILMDIQMPNLNGYGAAQKIRKLEDPELAGIPIIAMTANAFEEDRQNALDAGMNDHIAKPIDINVMVSAIASAMQTSKIHPRERKE